MSADARMESAARLLRRADLTLMGHPFAARGRGPDTRSCFRALRRVGLKPRVLDVDEAKPVDPRLAQEFDPYLTRHCGGQVTVVVVEGNEVLPALGRLGSRAANIVLPHWELERCPEAWSRHLEHFDQIWAPSRFIRDSIVPAVTRPVKHIPGATAAPLPSVFGRRYLGIPESSYLFLSVVDETSFVERENPLAVLAAFERTVRDRPRAEVSLVLKIDGLGDPGRCPPEVARLIRDAAEECPGNVVLLDRDFPDHEATVLLRSCDCLVSLHRSVGSGGLLAQSMMLGTPVIATGYSGNLDFMNPANSLVVPYRLVSVPPGAYPNAECQRWADPDVEEAARFMIRLVDDPGWGRDLGERASRHIRAYFSHRAIGLRYLESLHSLIAHVDDGSGFAAAGGAALVEGGSSDQRGE